MKDLIAKLEAASEGSRELDILIACAVGDYEIRESECDGMSELWHITQPYAWLVGSEFQWHKFDGPFYTTSIDAALTLVPEGMAWSIDSGYVVNSYAGRPIAQLIFRDGETGNQSTIDGVGNTPALAICIAALKARA